MGSTANQLKLTMNSTGSAMPTLDRSPTAANSNGNSSRTTEAGVSVVENCDVIDYDDNIIHKVSEYTPASRCKNVSLQNNKTMLIITCDQLHTWCV